MTNEIKEITTSLTSETGTNLQFFKEVIENSGLSEERKKKLGDFKELKNVQFASEIKYLGFKNHTKHT